jgi:hypothetical protein
MKQGDAGSWDLKTFSMSQGACCVLLKVVEGCWDGPLCCFASYGGNAQQLSTDWRQTQKYPDSFTYILPCWCMENGQFDLTSCWKEPQLLRSTNSFNLWLNLWSHQHPIDTLRNPANMLPTIFPAAQPGFRYIWEAWEIVFQYLCSEKYHMQVEKVVRAEGRYTLNLLAFSPSLQNTKES